MLLLQVLVAIVLANPLVFAHPGESDSEKLEKAKIRNDYLRSLEFTGLASCAPKLSSRGVMDNIVSRRREIATQLKKRNLEASGQYYHPTIAQSVFEK